MADLSNLLGAVYGEGSTGPRDPDGPAVPIEPAASERVPAVPDWADDEALDAAFAQWKPAASDDHDGDHDEDGDEGDLHSVVLRLNQRAAAAELTEASRFGDEPVDAVAVPAPTADRQPEPVALPQPVALHQPESNSRVASLPYVSDDPTAPPGPVFTGARQWERSDDDILPTKGGRRGFFSLSLRRG
jgi:hypothetical protein